MSEEWSCIGCGRPALKVYHEDTGRTELLMCNCSSIPVMAAIDHEELLRKRLEATELELEQLKAEHKKLMNRLSRKVQRLRSRLRFYEPLIRKVSFGRDDVPTKVVPGKLVEIVNTNQREEDEK